MTTTSNLELNNGVEIPALGLGVFQTAPDETRDAVRAALGAGYRHVDTAACGNESELSADEMAAIDDLDTGRRAGPEPDAITLEAFGREIPEA